VRVAGWDVSRRVTPTFGAHRKLAIVAGGYSTESCRPEVSSAIRSLDY
jgi:hypothetical protein